MNPPIPGEALSKHTTFRIGGPAARFAEVETIEDLRTMLAEARAQPMPWKVIGSGSNLLVSDQGFPGVVIKLVGSFCAVTPDDSTLSVGAGTRMVDVLSRAAALGLGGLEFLWGIPGTMGGGTRSNAGAFEHDLGEFVTEVQLLTATGEVVTLGRRDLRFGYRRSNLPGDGIITSVTLKAKRATPSSIAGRIEECRKVRLKTQPSGASAGCVFKNPKGEAAGRLIDQAGLKGWRVGDAVVSDKHANFIINEGKARCADVRQLMEIVKLKVEEKFGIVLEPEIELVSG